MPNLDHFWEGYGHLKVCCQVFTSCWWHVLLYINCEDCDGTNTKNKNDRMFYHVLSRPPDKYLIHSIKSSNVTIQKKMDDMPYCNCYNVTL